MEQLKNSGPVQAVKNFWDGLTPAQKATVSAFVALGIVAVFIVAMLASKPSQATLFTGLQSDDAGAVVAKLEEMKVPHELSADGTAIKVPAKDVHSLKLKLAMEGLPRGGSIGYELLDKNSFGMTEFNQRVNYKRALQGELARTLCELSQVSNARVSIAMPEDRLYSEEKENVTASVALRLKPGATLRDDQIAGVVHLVSSSVEGLKPQHVTVVDTDGNVLSEGGDDSSTATSRMTNAQVKLKRDYERILQRDIQSMLDRVVGPSKSIVRVSAKMNFDRKQVTSQVYEPLKDDKGVLISQDQVEEVYSGAGPRIGGAPGVPNNLRGPSTIRVGMASGDTYRRTESSTKYEVTKHVEEVVSAPGNVEKLSVAVMLDSKVDNSQVAAIQQTVTTAAGIDQARGDVVTVQQAKFDNTEFEKQDKEMATAARTATFMGIGKNAIAAILLIVFLLFLKSLFKRSDISAVKKQKEPEQAQPAVEQAPMSMPPVYKPVAAPVEMPVFDSAEPAGISFEQSVSKADLIARNRPEDVARLIKEWMSGN